MNGELCDEAVLTVMVLMTLADGNVAESEVMRMRWIHGEVLGRPVSEDEIRAIIARVRVEELEIGSFLRGQREQLSIDGKRKVLRAGYAIATADGRVLDEEDAMMLGIAKALEIPPAQYRAALSQMMVARELT